MVRTPSYVIRALRLLGVDVRSVEVEVKGGVNDRNRRCHRASVGIGVDSKPREGERERIAARVEVAAGERT